MASPSRLPAQDRPRGEEVPSLVQQAHGTGSPSKASSIATNALTDRSELEVQSEDDPTANNESVEEEEESSTSLNPVNRGGVTRDEDMGSITNITPRTPHTGTDLKEDEILEERGQVDSVIARPSSPTSRADFVDNEVSREPVQIAQASPSEPIEILSSTSSSSALETDEESDEESDQESDDVSRDEPDSLFDEQSESGQSNAAMYSGPTSDFGHVGSTFSRPSVLKRLEEGPKVDSLITDDAWDIASPIHSHVEPVESEAEEPSTAKASADALSLSDDDDSGEDIHMPEGHDAAQRRLSVQLSSSDQRGSPEAGEFDDEAIKDLAAAQLLADHQGSWSSADIHQDESAVPRSSSNPPSSSSQFESIESQDELELRSQEFPDDESALELIPEKSPTDLPKEDSPFSSRAKEDLSKASDEEDALGTSPKKVLVDSAVRQESPVTSQQEMVLDARLSQEDSKIPLTQGQEVRDRAESAGMLTSKFHQTIVEIIDLESGDEDDTSPQNVGQEGVQALVDENDSGFALKNEVLVPRISLPLAPGAGNEHQTPTDEAHRLSNLPDSTGLTFKSVTAVEGLLPLDICIEPEAHEENSCKPSPVAIIKGNEEELPLKERAPVQRLQGARLENKERELPSAEEPRLEQSPIAKPELKAILMDELPSTVRDSFEGPTSKSQLLTPSSTQRTDFVSQPSSVSFHSAPEDDTLPTPRLTQGTSAGIVPPQLLGPPEEATFTEAPAPPKKTSALIERLKEMRRLSNQSPKPRSSDASILDPWFAPKRLSQVVPDSEEGSEAESSPEREAHAGMPKIVGRQLPQTPERLLAKSFIRSPPQSQYISSIQSSPQYLPPSQLPPPGFRTNLSYFVPLASLTSHFATSVDILAIALSSTPVTRAASGPRDHNQTLYITDPSSSTLQHSITTTQIFRPNNRCFPLVEKGDALLLRNFKVQTFQRRPSLLSTKSSAWAVFRKGADVQIRGPPVEFGAEERGFARGLWDWWASIDDSARKRLENAVLDNKKPNGTAKTTKSKAGGKQSDAPIKKEEIEGLGIDLPGSQPKRRESLKERSVGLEGVEDNDTVHESIEAPKRVLRARGAKGANGRSESARESRFGTVFTGGLGEPDETQGSAHELRDGKAYRDKRR